MVKTKICTKCGKELPATTEHFRKAKSGKYGLRGDCKECKRNIDKSYYKNNKEKVKTIQKAYYEENKEKILSHNKEYYETNKGKILAQAREYKELNKESIRLQNQEWYKNNIDKRAKYIRDYRKDNGKKLSEKEKEWRKKNKHKVKMYHTRRRNKKAKVKATLTLEQWKKIKKDFDYKCAYCGKETNLEQEHFIPLSKGGEYTHNNIIPACRSCNASKNNNDFFDWYQEQEFYSKGKEKHILEYLNYIKEDVQQLALY